MAGYKNCYEYNKSNNDESEIEENLIYKKKYKKLKRLVKNLVFVSTVNCLITKTKWSDICQFKYFYKQTTRNQKEKMSKIIWYLKFFKIKIVGCLPISVLSVVVISNLI